MRNVIVGGQFKFTTPPAKAGDPQYELAVVQPPSGPPQVQSNKPPAQPPAKMNRKQRRRQKVFATKLKARLEKDNTPVTVSVLPDGGLDIKVDTRNTEPTE